VRAAEAVVEIRDAVASAGRIGAGPTNDGPSRAISSLVLAGRLGTELIDLAVVVGRAPGKRVISLVYGRRGVRMTLVGREYDIFHHAGHREERRSDQKNRFHGDPPPVAAVGAPTIVQSNPSAAYGLNRAVSKKALRPDSLLTSHRRGAMSKSAPVVTIR